MRHGEGDHFADARFVGQQHDDPVDSRGDSAVRRRAVAEGVDHPGEFGVDDFLAVSGEGERLVHRLGAVITDRARGDFVAVADEVVLIGENRQRVLLFERLQPALRHRKRIVRKLDGLGLLVHLVHRVIDDPGEFEDVLFDEIEKASDALWNLLLGILDQKPAEAVRVLAEGVVDGVTTNPSILLKDGASDLESVARRLAVGATTLAQSIRASGSLLRAAVPPVPWDDTNGSVQPIRADRPEFEPAACRTRSRGSRGTRRGWPCCW